MDLFLLRHGIAVEPGLGNYRDSERPLTTEGRQKMRLIAETLKALEMNFDLVLSSPFVRARQTAEIVCEVLGQTQKLKFSQLLAVDGDPKKMIHEVEKHKASSVLLVGHEPYLSTIISILVTGEHDQYFVMKKGGLCKLSVDSLRFGRCAILEWLAPPKILIRKSS